MRICNCAPDCEERIRCTTVGAMGHWQCGWCDDHNQARHCCGCMVNFPTAPPAPTEERPAAEGGGV